MIPSLEKQNSSFMVPETQKLFDGLKARSDDLRELACSELVEFYLKYSDNNEQINQVTLWPISSSYTLFIA